MRHVSALLPSSGVALDKIIYIGTVKFTFVFCIIFQNKFESTVVNSKTNEGCKIARNSL
jgi:hypothetical protein